MVTTATKDKNQVATRTAHSTATREPFIDLTDPARIVSRLFGDGWPHSMLGFTDHSVPGADVEETDEAYTIELELPGVAKENITVDVTGRRVTVHGERVERKRDGVLRHSTRSTGRFDYELTLPSAVDSNDVSASLSDGVLTVQLPKAKTERPRHITIS